MTRADEQDPAGFFVEFVGIDCLDLEAGAIGKDLDLCGKDSKMATQWLRNSQSPSTIDCCPHGSRIPARTHASLTQNPRGQPTLSARSANLVDTGIP